MWHNLWCMNNMFYILCDSEALLRPVDVRLGAAAMRYAAHGTSMSIVRKLDRGAVLQVLTSHQHHGQTGDWNWAGSDQAISVWMDGGMCEKRSSLLTGYLLPSKPTEKPERRLLYYPLPCPPILK